VTKYLRSTTQKEEKSLVVMVPEVSVHAQLALLPLGCIKTHGGWKAKRERKGSGSQYPLSVHTPNNLTSSHTAVPVKGSITSQ
jgi:hypothetical protein